MLRGLEQKLSNHCFSGRGQHLPAPESPYKIVLTICRAAVFSKDSCSSLSGIVENETIDYLRL